jgi:hypothetical protein
MPVASTRVGKRRLPSLSQRLLLQAIIQMRRREHTMTYIPIRGSLDVKANISSYNWDVPTSVFRYGVEV